MIKEKSELGFILDSMDVPLLRKKDHPWLLRNLAFRNKDHRKFPRAMEILKKLTVVAN
jgi:hypothetical protein